MTIPLIPTTPAVDDLSTISATTVNSWRANLARCIDGVGGSDGIEASPATQILIGGAGLALRNGNQLGYSSRSRSRVQTSVLYNLTAPAVGTFQLNVAASQQAYQNMDRLPHGSTLSRVTVYLARSVLGVAPTTRASGTLFKRDVTTLTDTTLVTTTVDPTSVLADYAAIHGFNLTLGSTEVVDNTKYLYFIRLDGEGGSNTETVILYPSVAEVIVTSQDEAP